MNLKKALETEQLDQFIEERMNDEPAVKEKFEAVISSMIGNSSKVQEASVQDVSDC